MYKPKIHFIMYDWEGDLITTACGRDRYLFHNKLTKLGLTKAKKRTTCERCKKWI